jgi:hypothetical protein
VFNTGPGGWIKLAQIPPMQRQERLILSTPKAGYRYYLVWITALPPNSNFAAINEIALYAYTH